MPSNNNKREWHQVYFIYHFKFTFMKRIRIKSLLLLVFFIGTTNLCFAATGYWVKFTASITPPSGIQATIFMNIPPGANATLIFGNGTFEMECDQPGLYTVTFYGIGYVSKHIDFYAPLDKNGKIIPCEPIQIDMISWDAWEAPASSTQYNHLLCLNIGDALKPSSITLT